MCGARTICDVCNLAFYAMDMRRVACDRCMESRSRHHHVKAADIAERDGTDCALCGEEIDMTIPWPHAKSATIDHIIPWTRGGTHALENMQLAHSRCNIRKGNKLSA